MAATEKGITKWLSKSHPLTFNLYVVIAAFCTYFSMYAFRKPFSVGTFEGLVDLPGLPPIDYKIVLIIAQVFGYTLSKFAGIKVVSEAASKHRGAALITLIIVAELALLGFAMTPKPFNIIFLFLNGMPLGMVWGLVFGFLEGRKTTEFLGAGLSASYIVASGAVKSVGRYFMNLGVSEMWMPFVTGLAFFPLFILFAMMLKFLPPPTPEEERLRTKRAPMNAESRKKFFAQFAPGLILLTLFYMFLTAYRDFRDNFAREIWDAVGYAGQPMVFTSSEVPIAFAVMGALALMMFIKNNHRAVFWVHGLLVFGAALIGVSTLGFEMGVISPMTWMVTVGVGLYLGYVPFGCILFDRIIASVGFIGTAGFMIYVADSFGYLGSVMLMLYRNFGHPELSWLNFFINFSYITSIACTLGFLGSMLYFHRQKAGAPAPAKTEPESESVPAAA